MKSQSYQYAAPTESHGMVMTTNNNAPPLICEVQGIVSPHPPRGTQFQEPRRLLTITRTDMRRMLPLLVSLNRFNCFRTFAPVTK